MTEATKNKISQSKKGSIPWNKGLKGAQTAWNKGLKGYCSGEKNGMWKGEKASYSASHHWINSQLGRPKECENCGTKDASHYEWSNMSGEYKRDVSDWARLCVRCHRYIDNWSKTVWESRRAG